MGVCVLECVCVVCEQILVIKYYVMLKDMSPPATSKTSCSLCCGDVAREVGDVCVCVLITKLINSILCLCLHVCMRMYYYYVQ